MTEPTPETGTLLAELLALPEDGRLPHLRAVGDPAGLLLALGEEADRLAAVEVGQALAASELVVALADGCDLALARADARRGRAMVLASAGRFEDALALCEQAGAIAGGAGLPVAAARARLASVQPLARLGRYDRAIAAGESARIVLAAAGEPLLAARADMSLGNVYGERDDLVAALAHYDHARLGLAGDPIDLAHLEINRGTALTGLDDFAGAETAFEAAVQASSEMGLAWMAAIAEGNLAYLATRQGRLQQALSHFERARRFLERDESPADLASLLAEQADVFALLGMFGEALGMYEKVLPDLQHHGLVAESALAWAGIGGAFVQLGRLAEAEGALARAAGEFDALGQGIARARVELTRSELAAARGHPEEARTLAAGALVALTERPAAALAARRQLARLAVARGDLPALERELAIALPTAEQLDLAPVLADFLHLRGLARRARGDLDGTLADLQAAVVQIERVRGTLQAERFRTAFLGDRLSVYEDAVVAALDRGGPMAVADSFATVERAKGRALLDLVAGALDLAEAAEHEAADPAEAALLADLARLRAELNWYYSQVGDDGDDQSRSAADGRWQGAVHLREQELDALQGRLAVARGVAGLYAPPLDLEGAQRLVPPGTALVEYFIAGDELLAFVLREGEVRVARRLATVGALTERARRLQFQIGRALAGGGRAQEGRRADRLLADVRRELGALDALLLAPLREAIDGAERLAIVPHGLLHTLPFHALWDGERHLIERCEVVYAPSASVLAHLASTDGVAADATDALVVGVPDAVAPRIGEEAERVARALGTDRLLLGEMATVERVTAAAREADIVHLACHGRFAPESPLGSGIKVANGWITARDIYALKLRASLVTLSGCETGRAAIGGGDELVGLVRGFFAAGASSLILSLWIVNDESTAELMTDFYGAWRGGATKPAALRAAQRALLARCPHPAYWAPFILGGQP